MQCQQNILIYRKTKKKHNFPYYYWQNLFTDYYWQTITILSPPTGIMLLGYYVMYMFFIDATKPHKKKGKN